MLQKTSNSPFTSSYKASGAAGDKTGPVVWYYTSSHFHDSAKEEQIKLCLLLGVSTDCWRAHAFVNSMVSAARQPANEPASSTGSSYKSPEPSSSATELDRDITDMEKCILLLSAKRKRAARSQQSQSSPAWWQEAEMITLKQALWTNPRSCLYFSVNGPQWTVWSCWYKITSSVFTFNSLPVSLTEIIKWDERENKAV